MAEVRLVDLEIIKRFSLAVRSEYADAQDVLDALDASRRAVEQATKRGGRAQGKRASSRSASGSSRKSSKKTAARRGSSSSGRTSRGSR